VTGAEIKAARKALKLNQEQLAAMLGYSGKTRISELETETRPIGESQRRLLEAYVRGYRPHDWPV